MEKIDLIVIDDDKLTVNMILSFLKDCDLSILSFTNSTEGLDKVLEHRPRMVFLDLNMPELNGDQLIIKLSEKYIFQTTSIFLISGAEFTEIQRMKMMTLGFDFIIKKPFNRKDLYQAIESVYGHVPLKKLAA